MGMVSWRASDVAKWIDVQLFLVLFRPVARSIDESYDSCSKLSRSLPNNSVFRGLQRRSVSRQLFLHPFVQQRVNTLQRRLELTE